MITKEALHKKTSQEITALLYEACLDNLEEAKEFIIKKQHMDANECLQKANAILQRLGAGINYEAGIIADQLDALYNYLADKIVEANLTKNIDMIDEVITHLEAISSVWRQAMLENQDRQSKIVKQKTNAYEHSAIYEN